MALPAWWLNCAWAGKPGRSRRVRSSDPIILGPKRHEEIGFEERVQHVWAAIAIGIVVGVQFAIFNIVTDGMMALGLTELAVVLFLLVPAAAISRTPHRVELAESLLLLATRVIFGALIVLGGLFQPLHHSLAGAPAAKGLRLRLRSSRVWMRSDPILLQRILLNLVSNAMQHTAQGSVLVSCRPTRGRCVPDWAAARASRFGFRWPRASARDLLWKAPKFR